MELSLFEKSKLDSLEKTIQAGMQTVFDVGSALLEVRDSKLYRSNHSTFEEYCRVRWGMSRPRAYQLIEAATVKGNLSPIGDIPKTESQLRPLTRLEPEQQKEAWEGAVRQAESEERSVIAKDVEDAVCLVKKDTIAKKWTGDQESYTPEKYIEAARRAMGSIDTDPASNHYAQNIVKAKTWYSKETNGLGETWEGNIFLNPPYSHPEIKHFVHKLLQELTPGQQAILLTNNNTDTNFFHDAAFRASVLCFTKGRINFLKEDGSFSSPTNGQVFFYFGDNRQGFITEFTPFGIIMETV